MTTRLEQYWQQLRESLWFVPGLMVLSSFGLAYGLIELDLHTPWNTLKPFPLLFGSGTEGSRAMLTAIAGSMLTVAALAFSLTLSTITQVSSQYSPRVLRNFMRDRVNQIVMGYFVSVFTYCLIVLGTIRSTDEGKFVPPTAVLAGLILALGGVAALIFFIHHISESLQTGTIVRYIYTETTAAIDRLFPDRLGEPVENPAQVENSLKLLNEKATWCTVRAKQAGYLQQINSDGLLDWATHHKAIIRIEQEVGAFVSEDTSIFRVCLDKERHDDEKESVDVDSLLRFVSVGRHRSIEQDVAFGIQQLVDIALKALSPGINDTTTAIMAIDYLSAVSERLTKRQFPARLRSDKEQVRVFVKAADFSDYIQLAFDSLRISAKGNFAVFVRLMRALSAASTVTTATDRKSVLDQQARLVLAYADQTLTTDYETQQVRALYDELKDTWKIHESV
jgi:uncharacterized membrane protein